MAKIESGVVRGTFDCCRYCTPPKRHVGCHASCKEYIVARGEHDRQVHEKKVESEADRWLDK